ncbi:hypothetical protein Tco_1287796 [Tanacetum coccineum]
MLSSNSYGLCDVYSSQDPIPTALKNFSISSLDLWSWFHNNEVPLCDDCNEAGIKKAYKTRESSEGSCHSLSISMAKAIEESFEVLVISSPTTGLKHVPSVHTKVVRVNRRSFAKKSRVPLCAKLYIVAELELATNNFGK